MQKKSALSSYQRTAKRPWLWLVLVGFLWLQFAGVVHKHSHTDLRSTGSALEQILPEHSQQNKSDCRLLDLQCAGLALGFSAIVLVTPPLQFAFEAERVQSFHQTVSGHYQARAPPKTSI
jgi:hypothetical protein